MIDDMTICPHCFESYLVGEASHCDHTPSTPVCMYCGQCRCGIDDQHRKETTPHPVMVAWQKGEAVVDEELLKQYRQIFDDLDVVPVGLVDGILYAFVKRHQPETREKLLAQLAEAGAPVERCLIRVKRDLDTSIKPIAGLIGKRAYLHNARIVQGTPRSLAVAQSGLRVGPFHLPRYTVEIAPEKRFPINGRFTARDALILFETIHCIYEDFALVYVRSGNKILDALGRGIFHTCVKEPVPIGVFSVEVRECSARSLTAVVLHPSSDYPERAYTLHVRSIKTCTEPCGRVCTGLHVSVDLEEIKDSDKAS